MRKLNNKGMAISSFITGLGILIFAFILTMLLGSNTSLGTTRASAQELIIPVATCKEYEREVEDAAHRYVNSKNHIYGNGSGQVILRIRILPVEQIIRNLCTGYVIVETGRYPVVSPAYLTCGDYQSLGYNRDLDG